MREVLTNLIFNAVDAMPRRRASRQRAHRRFRDTRSERHGHGMTEEVRLRCLEPFFSTMGERGTGLGLSMVRICSAQRSLDLRSAGGQTFAITFRHGRAPETAVEAQREKSSRLPACSWWMRRACTRHPRRRARDRGPRSRARQRRCGRAAFYRRPLRPRTDRDKAMPAMNGDQMAAAIKCRLAAHAHHSAHRLRSFHDRKEFPDIDLLASKPIRVPALQASPLDRA